MGRSVPSYTILLEETIKRIQDIGKRMEGDNEKIIKRIVELARSMQGPLYYNSIPDIRFLIILVSLIDIYKKLERLERCLSRAGSSK